MAHRLVRPCKVDSQLWCSCGMGDWMFPHCLQKWTNVLLGRKEVQLSQDLFIGRCWWECWSSTDLLTNLAFATLSTSFASSLTHAIPYFLTTISPQKPLVCPRPSHGQNQVGGLQQFLWNTLRLISTVTQQQLHALSHFEADATDVLKPCQTLHGFLVPGVRWGVRRVLVLHLLELEGPIKTSCWGLALKPIHYMTDLPRVSVPPLEFLQSKPCWHLKGLISTPKQGTVEAQAAATTSFPKPLPTSTKLPRSKEASSKGWRNLNHKAAPLQTCKTSETMTLKKKYISNKDWCRLLPRLKQTEENHLLPACSSLATAKWSSSP